MKNVIDSENVLDNISTSTFCHWQTTKYIKISSSRHCKIQLCISTVMLILTDCGNKAHAQSRHLLKVFCHW